MTRQATAQNGVARNAPGSRPSSGFEQRPRELAESCGFRDDEQPKQRVMTGSAGTPLRAG